MEASQFAFWADQESKALQAIRRELHKIPELARQEFKTQQYICDYLERLGVEYRKVADTGVYAIIRSGKPGRTIALRGDMDGLPIKEETDLPFRSLHEGRMHACGHDAHMTMLLGAATILSRIKDNLSGNVVFLFQPSEERFGGAERMIKGGVMDDPRVDAVIGTHVWPLPVGMVVAKAGPLMACPDSFRITVTGKGGHGAAPHLAVNPIIPLSKMVSAINDISALYVSPLEPVVASVCHIEAGSVYNVIPDSGYLEGTFRTYDEKVRKRLIDMIEQAVDGIVSAYGVTGEFSLDPICPATVNDGPLAEWAFKYLREINPEGQVLDRIEPSMVGEDFSFYGQKVPALFLWVGVHNEEKGCIYGLHHSRFNLDEEALVIGVRSLCYLAERFTRGQ